MPRSIMINFLSYRQALGPLRNNGKSRFVRSMLRLCRSATPKQGEIVNCGRKVPVYGGETGNDPAWMVWLITHDDPCELRPSLLDIGLDFLGHGVGDDLIARGQFCLLS